MANDFFRIKKGASLDPSPSPSGPSNGDLYYDSTKQTSSMYLNGNWTDVQFRSDVPSGASLTSANFTATVVQSSLIKVTGSTVSNIHGLTASADAKAITLYNATSVNIILKHQSGTEATAGNRIITSDGFDFTLTTGQSASLEYDSTQSRWIALAPAVTATPVTVKQVTTQTADYTILTTDDVVIGDASSNDISFTLPSAIGNTGKEYWVVRKDGSDFVITFIGVVNGVETARLYAKDQTLHIISDGSSWITFEEPLRYKEYRQKDPLSVKAATTANITLSGAQTIDTISVVAGDLVLVKNQTSSANDGVYVVAVGAWTRHTSADTASELTHFVVYVLDTNSTATNRKTSWYQNNVLSTLSDAQSWSQTPADYTFTVPAGIYELAIAACGSGGGGGGATGTTGNQVSPGGGGGSGAQPKAIIQKVTPNSTITISLAKGGPGGSGRTDGAAPGSNGVDGATTTITDGTFTLRFKGGKGGSGGPANGGVAGNGGAGGLAALTTAAELSLGGDGGGNGNGDSGGFDGFAGEDSIYALGGSGGVSTSDQGGGGGGGGAGLDAGGNGGHGKNGGVTGDIGNNGGTSAGGGGGGGTERAVSTSAGGAGGRGGDGYAILSW